MEPEFPKRKRSEDLSDVRLKNNSPAIQIHCKSCEHVDVSVLWICLLPSNFLGLFAPTDFVFHVGSHCWLLIHTPNTAFTLAEVRGVTGLTVWLSTLLVGF